jgi:hypothetical protein
MQIKEAYDILVAAGTPEDGQNYFDGLHAYFLAREKDDSETFTLKDAHNAVVRDSKHSEFRQAFMEFCIAEAEEWSGDSERVHLGVLAKEFSANGLRRNGIHLKQAVVEADTASDATHLTATPDFTTANELLAESQQIFREVEAHWEATGDRTSLKRVSYEFAELAGQDIPPNWELAAEYHKKAGEMAIEDQQEGDETAETAADFAIAQTKYCEACLKGELGAMLLDQIVRETENCTKLFQSLAEKGTQRAIDWVGNSHAHLAEAQEAVGDLEVALASWKACDSDPVVNGEQFRQLKDEAEKVINRLSTELEN